MEKIISFISAFLLCTCCVSAEEYVSHDPPQEISSVSVTEDGFQQDEKLTDISEEQEAAASKPAAPTVSGSITGVFGGRKIRFISETEDAVIYFSDSTSALTTNDRHAENGEEVLFEHFYGTVYARSYKDGLWSDPSRYILKIPEAKTPEIDVSDNTAVITTSPGNYIVYTTDGTDPVINTCADIREAVANGNLVTRNTASVTVASTTVIKAVAIRNTFTTSSTAQADVTVSDIPAPVFTTNIVFGGKAVTITSDDPDAVIYYKLGSSDISTDSPSLPQGEVLLFDEPFAGGIYAKAYKNGRWSKLSKTGLNNVKLAAPVIQKTSDGIRIYSAAKNSYICYTTDGTVPSVRSGINKVEVTNGKFAYSTDITVSAEPGQTVKAVVVRSGLVTSDTFTYTVPEDTSAGFDTKLTAFDITDRMTVGWNLGNSLDAIGSTGMSSETSWGNPKTTEKMIKDIKAAGFNTIRIPVSWGIHADDSGNIDSEWMDRVQQVVDYAYNNDMYIILNSHHDNTYYDISGMVSSTAICDRNIAKMERVWTQISLRFKDYDHRLLFETLNEPRTEGSANEWRGGTASERNVLSKLNNGIVSAVRATGGNNKYRFILVPGYAATSDTGILRSTSFPDDDRVIISVHAYSPYNFAMNENGSSTFTANDKQDLDRFFSELDSVFIQNGRAVIIGETGAINKNNNEDRKAWARYFIKGAGQYGIPCVIWDNNSKADSGRECFGLYNRNTQQIQFPDYVKAITDAGKTRKN